MSNRNPHDRSGTKRNTSGASQEVSIGTLTVAQLAEATSRCGDVPPHPDASTTAITSTEMHDSWKSSVVPLPGYASGPELLAMRSSGSQTGGADTTRGLQSHAFSIKATPPASNKKQKRKNKAKGNSAPTAREAPLTFMSPTPVGSSANGNTVRGTLRSRQVVTANLSAGALESTLQNMTPRAADLSTSSPSAYKLDVYADTFVPRYLKEIQNMPQKLIPLPPEPIFPPKSYLQEYLNPKRVEKAHKEATRLQLISLPSPELPTAENLGQLPALTSETYHAHFTHLLRWELDAQAKQKKDVVLWKVGIKVSDWDEGTFTLCVPNVRGDTEFGGRVAVGDLVHLREVVEIRDIRSDGREKREYIMGGQGTGIAFEGRVTVVRKREGSIHMYCPTLKQYVQAYTVPNPNNKFTDDGPIFTPQDDLPYFFNVSFLLNAKSICAMEHAVSRISSLLAHHNRSPAGNGDGALPAFNLTYQWLFPDDVHLQLSASQIREQGIKPEGWFDNGLNEEQRSAVNAIALSRSGLPYLISGPPGTGKSRTIVETVLQILRVQPEACILLCAPSNPATDTLVQRLRTHLNPSEMFRFNDQNRTFAEVPVEILQYTYVENALFALPPWKTFLKYRVVATSCMDAAHLAVAQFTNLALMELKEETMEALHPHSDPQVKVKPHWSHLIIDEAAQACEPLSLIPISVVTTHSQHLHSHKIDNTDIGIPQLVLCGDPNQLGPMICSEVARNGELDVSLLERLFERAMYIPKRKSTISSIIGVYPNAPKSPSIHSNPMVSFAASNNKRFTNLVKNYRSHPVILMPPSAIFYHDTLQPCARNGRVVWSGLPVPHLPIKFIGHNHAEATRDERATWYNAGEIRKVVQVIKSILTNDPISTPPLQPKEIGVMAPWREQVWKLREALRKHGLRDVDVGTVEDYQGREIRIVIISCVRSNPRFLEEDARQGLGIIHERKRMNVAITRAKEMLVVIGNGSLLQRDSYWKSFLQFCIRNKLYEGPDLDLESDGSYISKLESQLLNSDLSPEELGLLTAGGVARQALRE